MICTTYFMYILRQRVHLLQISSTLSLLWSCWSHQASNCNLVSLSSNPFPFTSSTTSLVFFDEETVSSLFTLRGSGKDLYALDRKWAQVASAQRAKVKQTRPWRVLQPSITVIELRQTHWQIGWFGQFVWIESGTATPAQCTNARAGWTSCHWPDVKT